MFTQNIGMGELDELIFVSKNVDFNKIYNTETAEIKIIKPEWIN